MEVAKVSALVKRLQKRKYAYNYCQQEWLDSLKLSEHQEILVQFARKHQLQLESLDSIIQQSVNTQFSLGDAQGSFASLMNYDSQELMNFIGLFSLYLFNQLIVQKKVASITFDDDLQGYFDHLRPEFNKSGLMYKNTLNPVISSLGKIYSMSLSRYEKISHQQVIAFGYFVLLSLLHKKVSNPFLASLQLQIPKSFTEFSKFNLENKEQVNAKQLSLLLQYIATHLG